MHKKLLTLALSALVFVCLGSCTGIPRTYDQNCSQPPKHWGTEKNGIGHLRIVNAIKIDDLGNLTWNNVQISEGKLRDYALQSGKLNPEPQLILEVTAKAPCYRVETIRRIMNESPICQGDYPICSEGRNWRDWHEGTGS